MLKIHGSFERDALCQLHVFLQGDVSCLALQHGQSSSCEPSWHSQDASAQGRSCRMWAWLRGDKDDTECLICHAYMPLLPCLCSSCDITIWHLQAASAQGRSRRMWAWTRVTRMMQNVSSAMPTCVRALWSAIAAPGTPGATIVSSMY